MTDTLADSRTSSRMFTEGVPLVVEDVTRSPRRRARRDAGRPRLRPVLHRPHVRRPLPGRRGLVRRPADRLRARCSWTRATATLHYAQSIFEGLKAYAQPDGSVATFRPEANAARFVRGAKRLAMPPVPEEAFLAAVDALVDADRDWVPTGPDQTLYIRPYQLASEPFLGVRPAHEYLFLVIASPAGRVLPARRAAGLGLPVRGLHPGRARRHRRRQVRRQLRGQPAGPGAGHRGRLRPGRLARRGGEALRRGDGRDEPVLRPRLRRRRRAGHPRAHRHAAARHHPRLADRRWPGELGHTVTERRFSRRRVAGRASPTARSPRPSPAAPPR